MDKSGLIWYKPRSLTQFRDILLTVTKRRCMTLHIYYGILKNSCDIKLKLIWLLLICISHILHTINEIYIININIMIFKLSRDNKI